MIVPIMIQYHIEVQDRKTMKSNAEKMNSCWKNFFESLVRLNNDHKIAVLLTYHSKSGQLVFGPNHVKTKMKSSLNCPCPWSCNLDGIFWDKSFLEDNVDLIHGMQQMDPSGMSYKYSSKLPLWVNNFDYISRHFQVT